MASFYTNEGDHHHMLPNEYLLNQKLSSYQFESRGEISFIPPPTSVEQINRQLDYTPDTNHHGLSLSLGYREPSLVHFQSDLNQYDDSRLFSLQHNGLKHVQQHYLSFGSVEKNEQYSDFAGALCSSKYLEVARDLLDELVSVHRVSMRVRDSDSFCRPDAKGEGVFGEVQEPSNNASRELSVSQRHELQDKMTKLVFMLDEVDRRYKQYRHQMQELASSFDVAAGSGASPPYTALALRTISCQFRNLRDAIKKQIISAQKGLGGDPNVNSNGAGVMARLRYVDQQLRQQKSVHQFGVTRQAWRPQRGLPENAVSVLRAWLFEHFLHPYPKDSEKVVLARETGLTRNQVANWFINARVRLWKPMIEEMYKEEFGFEETKLKSSPEHMTTTQDTSTVNHQSGFKETFISSSPADHQGLEIDACRGMNYANDVFQGNFRLSHMQTNHNIVHGNVNSNSRDNKASQKKSDEGTMGNQVTLALGLQRSENCPKPIGNQYFYVDPSNNNQNRFDSTNLLSADFAV